MMLKLDTVSGWEPFLNAFGKYSWRSLAGVFAASGAMLVFGNKLGVSDWEKPLRPWLLLACISTGVVLLTYAATFLVSRFEKRSAKGQIDFVSDGYNSGWSKQH